MQDVAYVLEWGFSDWHMIDLTSFFFHTYYQRFPDMYGLLLLGPQRNRIFTNSSGMQFQVFEQHISPRAWEQHFISTHIDRLLQVLARPPFGNTPACGIMPYIRPVGWWSWLPCRDELPKAIRTFMGYFIYYIDILGINFIYFENECTRP